MPYYGILSPAFTGHLNPITVLGRELKRCGHRVAVITPLDGELKTQKADLECIPIGIPEFPKGKWDEWTSRQGELHGLKASFFVGRWLGQFTRGIIRDLPQIIAREKFDGLVMDQIAIGAESVCAATGMPLAVACCALMLHVSPSLPPLVFSWQYRSGILARLGNLVGYAASNFTGIPIVRECMGYRRKHHLPFMRVDHINQLAPSLVQVAQQPAFFDFPRPRLTKHFHYTGPWKEPNENAGIEFPWEKLDGRPLIYASMGTLQNRLEHAFQTIAAACDDPKMQLVIGLGRKDGSAPDKLPGNPIVVGYAPQAELLKRASVVITHGGLNSTLECLMEGLPMTVIPVTNDQPGVAARVKHLGLGEFVSIKKLTVDNLRNAVRRVAETPEYRTRAVQRAKEIQQINGPARAAELIERAFASRKPVLRE